MVKIEVLTVKEVAELSGYADRHVRRLIKSGELKAEQKVSEANNRKQYLIEVASLPEDLQMKYYRENNNLDQHFEPEPQFKYQRKKEVYDKPLEEYTADEREMIGFWIGIIERWQFERDNVENATQFDDEFIRQVTLEEKKLFEYKFNRKFSLTQSTLYRKLQCIKIKDYDGLIGKRGGGSNKGATSVPDKVFSAFLYYYFDLNQPSFEQCYRTSIEWTKMFYPSLVDGIPSSKAFIRRYKREVPKGVEILMRKGNKAFNDEALMYIEREYKNLEANDCWVADNHTIDVISRVDGTDKKHRIYITAFQDAKTGVIVGWNVTYTPNSQSTLIALRHAIMRFGKPKTVYFDNGSEFLTNDIAGRGHRRRFNTDLVEKPPAILKKLEIEMKNALVKNAQAKPIERFFYTFKQQFSKMYDTYTGGNALERREDHSKIVKCIDNVPTDESIREHVELFMDGVFNVGEYGGAERKYKGMTRLEAFNESIKKVGMVRVKEDDLNLLLMRNKGYQKISRNGVYLPFFEKLWYRDVDTQRYLGKKVCVRYNPADLRTVRVYDEEDRFLFELPMARGKVNYLEPNIEVVQEAMREKASIKKMTKRLAEEFVSELTPEEKIDMMSLQIIYAHKGLEDFVIEDPENTEYFEHTERTQYMLYKDNELRSIDPVMIDIEEMNKRGVV